MSQSTYVRAIIIEEINAFLKSTDVFHVPHSDNFISDFINNNSVLINNTVSTIISEYGNEIEELIDENNSHRHSWVREYMDDIFDLII